MFYFSSHYSDQLSNIFRILLFPVLSPSHCQGILLPRYRRWSDAACPLPPGCPYRPRHSPTRSPDQHPKPWGGGVCGDHQQPHTTCVHGWEGLRQGLGHQPPRQQEPRLSARLSGEWT